MQSARNFIAFILILMAYSATAQADTLSKKKFHWGVASSDTSAGYAQALLADNVLYISGTIGHGSTMAEQMMSLYKGIERTLKHYGLGFQHIVKENLYTTDIEPAKASNGIRKTFYKVDFPAATWVQISRLYMGTALVEVEVIAHLPPKKE